MHAMWEGEKVELRPEELKVLAESLIRKVETGMTTERDAELFRRIMGELIGDGVFSGTPSGVSAGKQG